jgi:hypothetical protein
MAGWSKPSPHLRDSARKDARAHGHRMTGPYKRIGLSAELRCQDCPAYVLLPNAYAGMAWELEGFDGPAVREPCPASETGQAIARQWTRARSQRAS